MRRSHSFSLTKTLTTTALGLAMVASAASGQAQTSGTRFGVAVSYADHFNLGLGAFVKFHLTEISGHTITGRASFDYFFPGNDGCNFDDCPSVHYWQAAFDGLLDIANPKSDIKPYVGAGLGLSHYSVSDCDIGCGGTGGIGLNILGGINFMANSKLQPFVEVKLGLAGGVGAFGGSVFVLKGGIHLK